MAVHTVLNKSQIEGFIQPYGLGQLKDFSGIADGIENSNYFVTLDNNGNSCQLVLTVYEAIELADLTFYCQLTTALAEAGLPVPSPLADKQGGRIQQLEGKPATLVPRMRGKHPDGVNAAQCAAIGEAMAQAHLLCLQQGFEHRALRDLQWLQQTARQLADSVPAEDRDLLAQVGAICSRLALYPQLPQAVIHGDLFRDNSLFDGDRLTGIIDFNSAGSGYLMLDLAICINDWCSREDGSLNNALSDAMLAGYRQQREPEACERGLWNEFLCLAACRFWLSRLSDQQLAAKQPAAEGSLLQNKDPRPYKEILQQRLERSHSL